MARIQDIDIPYLEFAEAAAPGTPAAAVSRLYVKADGLFYSKDDAGTETLVSGGTAMSNPMTTVGDVIQGGASGAPARLAAPLIGKVLTGQGVGTAVSYDYPPGYQLNYVEFTANVNVTATTETTSTTIVTGGTVTFDGTSSTIQFHCPDVSIATDAAGRTLFISLFQDGVSIGRMSTIQSPAAASFRVPINLERTMTPSAGTHSYSIRGYVNAGTSIAVAGAGGTAAIMPGFIRYKKV